MSKKWFWVRVLVMLVVVGLLAGGGFALYRAGWSQGHAAVQLEGAGGEGEMAFPGFGYPGRAFGASHGFVPFMFGAGLIFRIGLLLLFIILISRLLRFVIWGPAWRFGMARSGFRPSAHWHRMHGPVPPWCWGEPAEEKGERVEPQADTGAAEV